MKKSPHAAPLPAKGSLIRTPSTFDDFFNQVNIAVSVFGIKDNGMPGMYIEVNDVLCKLLGYTRKELLCISPLDISEEVEDQTTRDIVAASKQNTHLVVKRTLVTKDGRRIPVQTDLHYITYAGRKAVLSITRDISDKKMAEYALLESEERFSKAFHASPMPMTISRLSDGVFVDINDEFVNSTGWTRTEILGRTTPELGLYAHPEDRQVVLDMLKKDGHVRNLYLLFKTKSGETYTYLWSAEIINVGGEQCLLTTSQDITAHKKTEEALRKSEEKYRTIFENMAEGVFQVTPEGCFITANPALAHSLGYASVEELLASVSDIRKQIYVDPTKHAELRALLINRGHANNFQVQCRKKDGGAVCIQMNIRLVKDEAGKILYHEGTGLDITERKQAEDALRESEEKYRCLVDNANQVVIVVQDGRFQFINRRAEQLWGYSEQDYLKRPFIEFIHQDDRHLIAENHERRVKGELIHERYEFRIFAAEGSIHWVEINPIPILWKGKPATLDLLTDITERKRIEEELHKAQKLDALGILAAGIAHDFNNLLTGIFGNIELARSLLKDEQAKEYLGATIASMNRARALTQQLLTFAKGGAPIQKITPLMPFLQETAQFALSGSNVSCRFSMSEQPWACNIDKNQIAQVIDNIVINAQQAMPDGGAIVITATNVSLGENDHPPLKKGDYVKVSIRDFGIGIPKDIIPRIFDPFYTTKTKGHGLGLATCYSIITRHSGCIDVESEPGKGATFHIFLPAKPSTPAVSFVAKSTHHRGQGTVLVMDDEHAVTAVLREFLKSMGYAVDCAANGEEAVEKYKKTFSSSPYVLAILDLTVQGGMGGEEAVKEILKINPSIVAIAASGYSQDPVMTAPSAFGFKGSIGKPFTKEELKDVLERVSGISK